MRSGDVTDDVAVAVVEEGDVWALVIGAVCFPSAACHDQGQPNAALWLLISPHQTVAWWNARHDYHYITHKEINMTTHVTPFGVDIG